MGVGQVTGLAEQLAEDIAAVDHYLHSRWRVYPQDATSTTLLTATAAANTFGAWMQIIPIDTIPFDFHIVGIVVESVNAATTYYIQIGCSPTAGAPTADRVSGERRFRIAVVPIRRASEVLQIHGQKITEGCSAWARLKTASGAADTANISIVLSRHTCVSEEIAVWPTFPGW